MKRLLVVHFKFLGVATHSTFVVGLQKFFSNRRPLRGSQGTQPGFALHWIFNVLENPHAIFMKNFSEPHLRSRVTGSLYIKWNHRCIGLSNGSWTIVQWVLHSLHWGSYWGLLVVGWLNCFNLYISLYPYNLQYRKLSSTHLLLCQELCLWLHPYSHYPKYQTTQHTKY